MFDDVSSVECVFLNVTDVTGNRGIEGEFQYFRKSEKTLSIVRKSPLSPNGPNSQTRFDFYPSFCTRRDRKRYGKV